MTAFGELSVQEELGAEVAGGWGRGGTARVRDEAALRAEDRALLDVLHAYATDDRCIRPSVPFCNHWDDMKIRTLADASLDEGMFAHGHRIRIVGVP